LARARLEIETDRYQRGKAVQVSATLEPSPLMGPSVSGLIFLQLAVLLGACHLVAYGLRRLEQPPVVGQMVAGILLGPSALAILFPTWQQWLFPSSSMNFLRGLGQVGLVLYMFVVGTELNHGMIKRHIKGATAVSLASVVVPLLLGGVLALYLVGDHRLFPLVVSTLNGTLFFAAAIAVTAFPVMARIIAERHLSGTVVANIALAAGSVSDVVAWCLLAVVVASLRGNFSAAVGTIVGAITFTLFVVLVVRRVLPSWTAKFAAQGANGSWPLAAMLMLLMMAAWATDAIGIHPAFGAFVLGAAAPRNEVIAQVRAKISPLAVNLLLPLFFVYAGLNTSIGLINRADLALIAAAVVVVACSSKLISCWLTAILAGHSSRDGAAIGLLMNARGLVELIILTTGLERGVITPTLFSILVLMALVTTLMASPLLRVLYGPPRALEHGVDLQPAYSTSLPQITVAPTVTAP
jgi:Kef-type K+ transport system membrane component KefB